MKDYIAEPSPGQPILTALKEGVKNVIDKKRGVDGSRITGFGGAMDYLHVIQTSLNPLTRVTWESQVTEEQIAKRDSMCESLICQ